MSHRTDGINRRIQRPVRPILKPHGERQARGKLAVQLALRRARTDRADAQQIRQELRRYRVEHLACDRHPLIRQADEQLPRQPQALVDVERVVDVRVVNQALPADRRAWLLEVGAHHDEQVVGVFPLEREQPVRVLERRGRVVDRAWADDDEEARARVPALHDRDGLGAGGDDGVLGCGRLRDLVLEQVGRCEWVVAADAPVFRVLLVAEFFVLDVELWPEKDIVSEVAALVICHRMSFGLVLVGGAELYLQTL